MSGVDPRNGPARALSDAAPDTPISELPELVENVHRWVCDACGSVRFTPPEQCRDCGGDKFDKKGGGNV